MDHLWLTILTLKAQVKPTEEQLNQEIKNTIKSIKMDDSSLLLVQTPKHKYKQSHKELTTTQI
jgi:hypothetical protein